jgi:hypothetical protein
VYQYNVCYFHDGTRRVPTTLKRRDDTMAEETVEATLEEEITEKPTGGG